jgi:hypothetical protein
MAVLRRTWALALLPFATLPAYAGTGGQCHVIDVDFTPAANLQIVAWVEDTAGHYLDTVYITAATGTYGIGNRPGRFDFNSGSPLFPQWPYGRRTTTFPVWAHRHGLSWPEVDYQNADDNNLSHPYNQSSRETHFCRPLLPNGTAGSVDEQGWDTGTCASTVFTDKGVLSTTKTSLYPPRQDVTRQTGDTPDVDMYGMLNPFDAVSQATPPGGMPATASWPIPPMMTPGNYIMFVEVSREFDMNGSYNQTVYPPLPACPATDCIPWAEYGAPYRGQPSIVYKVPFSITTSTTTADTMDYIGYGDPDGIDGNLRAPDATITTNMPGSGAARFQLVSDNGMYRVRVVTRNEDDSIPPSQITDAAVSNMDTQSGTISATLSFTAVGDDGLVGKAQGYDIRYRAGTPLTEDNFEASGSTPIAAPQPGDPGTQQTFTIDKLLPETDYYVGIRAFDKCHNTAPLSFVQFRTPDRVNGEVPWCFVATAAYGSVLASDVDMLRRFRNNVLKSNVFGELAVEAYYTFGPAMAGVISESDLLRATARDVLAPIVRRVEKLSF